MTNTQHIDVDSEEFEDAPKALRDAYKKLQKQLETTATERDTFKNQVVSQAVGTVLADKGFKNPKRVERDLLSDGIDPLDTAAVEKWLGENSDDYAKGDVTPATAPPEQNQDAAALAAIQSVANDSTAVDAMTKFQRAQAEITDDMDGAQVAAIYKKHGV